MLSPTPPSLRFPPDSFNNVSQGQKVIAQGPLGGTQVSINSLVPYSLQGLEQGPVAAQKENGPQLQKYWYGIHLQVFSSLTNALEGNLSFLTDLKPLNSAWYDKLSSSPPRRPCQRLWAALSLQYRNCDLDLLYPLQSLHLKVQGIRLCSDSDFLTGLVTQ